MTVEEGVKEVILKIHTLGNNNNRRGLCEYIASLDVKDVDGLLEVIRGCRRDVNIGEVLRGICVDERFVVKGVVGVGVGICGKRGAEKEELLGVVGGICGGREGIVEGVVKGGLGLGVGVVEVLCEVVRGIKDGVKARFWGLVVVRGVREGWWGCKGGGWREVLALLAMRGWLGDVGEGWIMQLVKGVCRRGNGGIEVVELVGRIVERIERGKGWVQVLRWVLGNVRSVVFADVLCVLELEIADRGLVSLEMVTEYERLLRRSGVELDDGEVESDEEKFGCKDVASLISIMRNCSDESVKKRALKCLTKLLTTDSSLIDVSDIASGSSNALEPKYAPFVLMRGFLLLSGMEQRVSTFIYFSEQLICSKEEVLVDWGVRLLKECFLRFEKVRLDIINRSFSAMVEQDRPMKVRAGFCKLFDLLTSSAQVHVLRAHASDIGQWLSFISLVPLSLATRLTESLAHFADCCLTFRDMYMAWLRKLTFCKTFVGHQIVTTGLCTLLSTLTEGSDTCEEILTSLLELIDSSTIPLRANILMRVRPFLCKYLRLREAITNRLGKISDGPFRLNSCIAVDNETVRLVDAVPALIRGLVVIRNMSSAEQGYLHYNAARDHLDALIEYVLDPAAALFHAIHNGGKLDLKVALDSSISKLTLLLSICETLFEPAKENEKFKGMIRIHAITAIVRSALRAFAKQNGHLSSRTESHSLARKELMTAREAGNVDWNDPQSMIDFGQNSQNHIETQSVEEVLSSENEYILVRCASATEALLKISCPELLHQSCRTRILEACLHLFRDTHPWAANGGTQNLFPETNSLGASELEKTSTLSARKSGQQDPSANEPTDSSGVPANSTVRGTCTSDPATERELPSELEVEKGARFSNGVQKRDMVNISYLSAPLEEEENDRGACFRQAACSLVRAFGPTSSSDHDLKIARVAISSLLSAKTNDTRHPFSNDGRVPHTSNKRQALSALSSSSSTTSVKPAAIPALPPFPSKLTSSLDRDEVISVCRVAILQFLAKLKNDIPFQDARWASLHDTVPLHNRRPTSKYTPLLQCLKKDFEHSMSLPLALKYSQLLYLLIDDAEEANEDVFSVPEVSNAICEILNRFEIRQATLLRCLMSIVLKTLPLEERNSLVLAIGRMVSYPSRTKGGSDDEDISLDVDSLPSDILRAGLIMDGVLPGNDSSNFVEAYQRGNSLPVAKNILGEGKDNLVINLSVIQGWTGERATYVLYSVISHLHRTLSRPTSAGVGVIVQFLQHLYDNEGCDVSVTFGQSIVQNLVSKILSEGRKALSKQSDEDDEQVATQCCDFASGKVAKLCVSQNPRLTLGREMLAIKHYAEDSPADTRGITSQSNGPLPLKRRRSRGRRQGARVLRSRNRVIDEWLSKDAHDDDDFADLENFVVDVEDDND